jgi:nucleoside-diphosphate kinase
MALQRTLCIIKPDAMEAGKSGAIVARLQEEGFSVKGMRQLHLSRAQAEGFYDVHRERPFFGELVEFMSRGPIVVVALEAENAIEKYRKVIGATNPADAAEGTIRKLYGTDVGENAVHGSDAPETAANEIGYFFAGCDVRPSA